MTAEQFVKCKYPSARAINTPSNFNFGMKHCYTIIKVMNGLGMEVNLCDGDTESKAWVKAKKLIKSETLS